MVIEIDVDLAIDCRSSEELADALRGLRFIPMDIMGRMKATCLFAESGLWVLSGGSVLRKHYPLNALGSGLEADATRYSWSIGVFVQRNLIHRCSLRTDVGLSGTPEAAVEPRSSRLECAKSTWSFKKGNQLHLHVDILLPSDPPLLGSMLILALGFRTYLNFACCKLEDDDVYALKFFRLLKATCGRTKPI